MMNSFKTDIRQYDEIQNVPWIYGFLLNEKCPSKWWALARVMNLGQTTKFLFTKVFSSVWLALLQK